MEYEIYKRRSRLNIRKNFFCNRVVDNWNDLPEEVISCDNVLHLKDFWIKYGGIRG